MTKPLLIALSFFCLSMTGSEKPNTSSTPLTVTAEKATSAFTVAPSTHTNEALVLYDELGLAASGLSRDVYALALKGMQRMAAARPLLSIVDMSQPSSKKRLYIIDLAKHKLLFNTYVAHGRNSGELLPTKFSNTNSSYQSSLGFYQTMGLYQGKHGLSMQLKGLERGWNDNAFSRAIVMHGADYVCEDFIKRTGRLGRSQGCPAVSPTECASIVKTIAGGSCLFIYSPNETYLKESTFLKG
ncbi:murein L,D-transpeptidase catalytic domain family protein [Fibrella sp. WM1]|uniref:murein L,D-transpeptidase catalytic domain family protein n=1 Tax=Fibrella musci TaxID=3242485 RepID=UPI00351FC969